MGGADASSPTRRADTRSPPQRPPPAPPLHPGGWAVDDWASAFVSQPSEFSYWATVEGAVPARLVGTLFRNGPGRFERGDHRYNHMVRCTGGVGGGGGRRGSWRDRRAARADPPPPPPPLPRPQLDGDGYVTAFSFLPGGRVHFRSRYVRTR